MYTLSLVQLCGKSSTQCKKALKKKVWEKAKKVIEVHRSQKGRHKTILTCNDMAIYAKQFQKSPKPFLELVSEFSKVALKTQDQQTKINCISTY